MRMLAMRSRLAPVGEPVSGARPWARARGTGGHRCRAPDGTGRAPVPGMAAPVPGMGVGTGAGHGGTDAQTWIQARTRAWTCPARSLLYAVRIGPRSPHPPRRARLDQPLHLAPQQPCARARLRRGLSRLPLTRPKVQAEARDRDLLV